MIQKSDVYNSSKFRACLLAAACTTTGPALWAAPTLIDGPKADGNGSFIYDTPGEASTINTSASISEAVARHRALVQIGNNPGQGIKLPGWAITRVSLSGGNPAMGNDGAYGFAPGNPPTSGSGQAFVNSGTIRVAADQLSYSLNSGQVLELNYLIGSDSDSETQTATATASIIFDKGLGTEFTHTFEDVTRTGIDLTPVVETYTTTAAYTTIDVEFLIYAGAPTSGKRALLDEVRFIVDPVANDPDADGISTADENSGALNPFDSSGVWVGAGNGGAPTDPNDPDSDGDGIKDGAEIGGLENPFTAGMIGTLPGEATSPMHADTDGDALPDKWEIDNLLDPNDDGTITPNYGAAGDPDSDLLTNLEEYDGFGLFDSTDPNDSDSDDDELTDKEEVTGSENTEFSNEPSDPNDDDTDDDGLKDGDEITGAFNPFLDGVLDAGYPTTDGDPTDPTNNDSDADLLMDRDETDNRLDPNDDGFGDSDENGYDGDPDEDSLINADEITAGTDPRNEDTDDDGLWDEEEFAYSTNPLKYDTDGDTVSDGDEVYGKQNGFGPEEPTEPTDPDSDDDGISDGLELKATPQTDPNDYDSVPEIKPVAYWPLNETSGSETLEWIHGNNGTATGTPAWAAGQIGNAVVIQGASQNGQWFSTPQLTGLNGSVAVTLCAWINPASDTRAYQGIFSTRGEGPSANENWGLNMDPNAANTDNRVPTNITGGSNGINGSAGPYSIDTWYHIAMVFNPHDTEGKTVRIYTDGVEDTTTGSETYPTTLTGLAWTIGVDLNDPNGRDFEGMIDDIAVFAAPLPAEDITAIYDAGILGTSVGTLYSITDPTPPATDFMVTTVDYDAVAETVDLTWSSAGAIATYSIISTVDLSLPRSSWDVEASGLTALTYQVTGVTDTKRFYVIVAE